MNTPSESISEPFATISITNFELIITDIATNDIIYSQIFDGEITNLFSDSTLSFLLGKFKEIIVDYYNSKVDNDAPKELTFSEMVNLLDVNGKAQRHGWNDWIVLNLVYNTDKESYNVSYGWNSVAGKSVVVFTQEDFKASDWIVEVNSDAIRN